MGGSWIQQLIAEFGAECRTYLGLGDPEAALRRPVEKLVESVGERWHLAPRLYPEVRRPELGVRPDYAVRTHGQISGYLELKRPEKDVTPGGLQGPDRKQWEIMHRLPNVLYTNGRTWVLYQHGAEDPAYIVHLEGDVSRGRALRAPGPDGASFETLLRAFLSWQPQPITSVRQLVRSVAPLCRLLREEVVEQLEREAREPARKSRPFTALARHWERELFPTSEPTLTFADRYAQTITFALLLARVEEIPLAGSSLHEVGRCLGMDHTVMGRALQILTDDVTEQFGHCLDLLVRVADAVQWAPIREREPNAHVDLYEDFLQEYDSELRRRSGTYYTPQPLAHHMTRLADEVLRTRLRCRDGFADSRVTIVDPAMGTGTFLSEIIDLVADRRALRGDGFRGEAVEELAHRLIGFEREMGAFAVAQMRIMQTLRRQDTHARLADLALHLADTLADPWRQETLLHWNLHSDPLLRNRAAADEIKRDWPVTVVIGNPPDRERAEGEGGWIEKGAVGRGAPLLDAFRLGGPNGRHEHKLKNLYVYFWRWATYKVFEQHRPGHQQGVVCFISTAGFLRGPGFKGMREYLRRMCSEGWIIDLSPEGIQPDVPTRLFPGVQQQLAIAMFVRGADTSGTPAAIRYVALSGSRAEKYEQLAALTVDGEGWRPVRDGWYDPFTPEAATHWDDFPALGDVLPWKKPGVKPNRTWVYAPDPDTLRDRWDRLTAEPDLAARRALFKETRDRTLNSLQEPLPGRPRVARTMAEERDGECPEPVRVSYRAFDRQWIIPDSRVIDRPRSDLWRALRPDQLFLVEQHSQPITSGPAVVFSALLPDQHCFNGRGGRVLPLLHMDGSPNIAPGFLQHLTNSFGGLPVTAGDLAAYIAAVTAHPGFTRRFADELNTPGIRVPLTADRALWLDAVTIGRRLIWAATFGERCADEDAGRPAGRDGVWSATTPHVRYLAPVGREQLPGRFEYDTATSTLHLGGGAFGPVSERMRTYDVGGQNILDRWLSRRGSPPAGRKLRELDRIRPRHWQPEWSRELQALLAVLWHLVELEPAQEKLLGNVLAGPLITVSELARRRILAVPVRATKPRPAAPHHEEVLPGTADLDTQEPHAVQPVTPSPDTRPPSDHRRSSQASRTPDGRRRHSKRRHPRGEPPRIPPSA